MSHPRSTISVIALAITLSLAPAVHTAQARPDTSASAAIVYRVQVDQLNAQEPDGTRADFYRVLLYNPGSTRTVWFKVWALVKGKKNLPVVITANGGTKLVSPKLGKWKTRIQPGGVKEVSFTARAVGAKKYCAEGAGGKNCSSSSRADVGGTV
jgi:hypothetical protein